MKKTLKVMLGGVFAVVLALNIVSLANLTYEKIQATLDYELKLQLNGAEFKPTETDGSRMYPILYKGRTYLPVAALGEALDVPIGWDGETRTVIIGTNDTTLDLMKYDVTSGTTDCFKILEDKTDLILKTPEGDKQFNSGMQWDLVIDNIFGDARIFETNGRDTLKFTAWSSGDAEIRIIGNSGLELARFEMLPNEVIEKEINIKGESRIKIYGEYNYTGPNTPGRLKIFDPIVYNSTK